MKIDGQYILNYLKKRTPEYEVFMRSPNSDWDALQMISLIIGLKKVDIENKKIYGKIILFSDLSNEEDLKKGLEYLLTCEVPEIEEGIPVSPTKFYAANRGE